MGKKLTDKAIADAAKKLHCQEAAIRAVIEVESRGLGFLSDGRPRVLFEGHIFYRQLKTAGLDAAALAKEYPGVVYPTWTKAHYRGGAGEWMRLNLAISLHAEAALCSASWGMFQLMGMNHKLCGHGTVTDFAAAMHESADRHLEAFIHYLLNTGLDTLLRTCQWDKFARRYNGPAYAVNMYDVKLADAYKKHGGTS